MLPLHLPVVLWCKLHVAVATADCMHLCGTHAPSKVLQEVPHHHGVGHILLPARLVLPLPLQERCRPFCSCGTRVSFIHGVDRNTAHELNRSAAALTLSPGPAGGTPRRSLLHCTHNFLSAKSPSFRCNGDLDSPQLQADGGPRGFGSSGLQSPREAPIANMLQSMRSRMRWGCRGGAPSC